MSKKNMRVAGIVLSILALISLILPIYGTNIREGEGWLVDLRGYDVSEFSVWGIFVILMPIMTIGVMWSKLSDKSKFIITIALGAFGIVSVYLANSAVREWIYNIADGFVYVYGGLSVYVLLFALSAIFFCIFCNMKEENVKSISVSPVDIYEEEFILPDGKYTFSVLKKGNETAQFPGNISFATADGYFAAIGQFDGSRSVEVLDGDENVGFEMRTMPSGIYGAFYEGMGNIGSAKFKLKPFSEVRNGKSELWFGGKKTEVDLDVKNFINIRCTLCDEVENPNELSGGVIIQDGKLASVVSESIDGEDVFTCISAEQVAADLGRMIYEQRILEAVNADEKLF